MTIPRVQPHKPKVVGYLLGKIDDENVEDLEALLQDAGPVYGHVTSLAVLRSHRKLGVGLHSACCHAHMFMSAERLRDGAPA